ncbi:MAG: prolyl-tRNA synthetase associated domain-containing protein [Lawsonibacter sp.]
MYIDPVLYQGRPQDQRIPQEEAVYDKLDQLGIHYARADHDHANTMEDCLKIESLLGAPICKNLFLCNRQQTQFYLLMMPGEKPFKTKYLSAQLGCARLSFADSGHMEQYLQTIPGSVSALELLFDREGKVQLVIDRELLKEESISGHPGISTSTLRLKQEDLLRYVQAVGHEPIYIDLPDPRKEGSEQ